MTKVKYYFDTFKHLNSFDIIPYQEVVDLYLRNQYLLENKENYEPLGGENDRPINSDKEKIDKDGFWFGFAPKYFNVDPLRNFKLMHSNAKADVVSMDMRGLGKTWTHFMYLELPKELFLEHQVSVHSNPDISVMKEFVKLVDSKEFTPEEVYKLVLEFDTKYKDKHSYSDYFDNHEIPAWRADFEVGQYLSIRDSGIIYPVCYNNPSHILSRGSHRALFCALAGFDIPIFIQYPMMEGKELDFEWEVKTANIFGSKDISLILEPNSREMTINIK